MNLFGKSDTSSASGTTTVAKRKEEVEKLFKKYPARIPTIVQRADSARNTLPQIDKAKFLVPNDFTFGQFICTIRKRIRLAPEQALYLYVNNVLPPSTLRMSEVYDEHKSEDGFLYIVYQAENSFGTV